MLVTLFRMMAQNVCHSRAPSIILFILSSFNLAGGNLLVETNTGLKINSVRLVNENLTLGKFNFLLEFNGTGITDDLSIVNSYSKSYCDVNNKLRKVSTAEDGTQAFYQIFINPDYVEVKEIYFCVLQKSEFAENWVNLGPDHTLILPNYL